MTHAVESEAEKAREETVEVLLGEAQTLMSRQFETIDGLDSKASQLFQVVTLATTLLTIAQGWFFQKEEVASVFPWWAMLVGFATAVLLYGATVYCLMCAYRIRVYYLPLKMDREYIRTGYLSLTKSQAREKLLASYIKYSQVNRDLAGDKAKWVDRALKLVGIDIILLMGAIAVGTLVVSR